jgi:cell division protease FtsH
MDGFTPTEQLVVIAATNRPDILDSALVRPGRFDRRVMISYPDIEGRKEILAIHAKNKPFDKKLSWDGVAKRTVGFSGADLENMLNEAAILAARGNKKVIDMIDIEEAATKVKMGPEKKRLQTEEDKRITAYHESGHAIVSYAMPHADPVHRISIIGRGMSLGHTLIPPQFDRVHETKNRLLEQIATMLGGRVAEELMFSDVTTGAANDIEKATEVARTMVIEYGMSRLGPINLSQGESPMFGGEGSKSLSDTMQNSIDKEVSFIIDEAYKRAVLALKQNKKKLDEVAGVLMKKETLEGEEFEKIMKGTKTVDKKVLQKKTV